MSNLPPPLTGDLIRQRLSLRERLPRHLVRLRTSAVWLGPVALVLEHGFAPPGPTAQSVLDLTFYLMAGVLTVVPPIEWALSRQPRLFLRERWPGLVLVGVTLLGLLVLCLAPVGPFLVRRLHMTGMSEELRWWCELAVGLHVLAGSVTLYRWTLATGINPLVLLVGSFAVVVVLGTVLLCLPMATADGTGAPLLTALFTSTSATCVTGLVVEHTGRYFSRFGHTVILIQMQLGGLGLMTFGAFLALLAGRGLRLRESVAMRDVLDEEIPRDVGRLVVLILALTFIAEVLGTVAMWGLWPPSVRGSDRLFHSFFHATSAFCNAGFSLTDRSFVDYGGRWQVMIVVSSLIILGGLGFVVLVNLGGRLRHRFVALVHRLAGRPRRFDRPPRLTLQTKLVLTTTVALLVGGTVLLLILEWTSGSARPLQQLFAASFFQAVTARTAGFNTVEIGALAEGSQFVLILLMFVGASPGSTGGGIKTATIGVIVASLWSALRGRPQTEAFKRTVPTVTVVRAMTVVVLFLTMIAAVTLVLMSTERAALKDVLFEVTSAASTVGLSTGITAQLSSAGRVMIIAVMFVGRVGPLTLLLALNARRRHLRYEYPFEHVTTG